MSETIPAGKFKKLKLPGAKGFLYLGGEPRGVAPPKDAKMTVSLGTNEGVVPWDDNSQLGVKIDLTFSKKEYSVFIKYVANMLKNGDSVCIGYEKATRPAAVLTGLLRTLDPDMTPEAVVAWVLDQFHPEPFANSHWPGEIFALLGVQFPGGKAKKQAVIDEDYGGGTAAKEKKKPVVEEDVEEDDDVAEPDEDD